MVIRREVRISSCGCTGEGCRYVNYSWWYSVKSLPPNTGSCGEREMKCILVLEEGLEPEEKRDFNGNYFLYHLLGAENVIVVRNGADLMEEMHKVAKK